MTLTSTKQIIFDLIAFILRATGDGNITHIASDVLIEYIVELEKRLGYETDERLNRILYGNAQDSP